LVSLRFSTVCILISCHFFIISHRLAYSQTEKNLSETSAECLSCHRLFTPGIYQDWRQSRHARVTLQKALQKPPKESRFSLEVYKKGNYQLVVGCAECHTLNPKSHKDTFEHYGYDIHVVVTPTDCAHCHPREQEQFVSQNKMAHAYGNLHDNPYYQNLIKAFSGPAKNIYLKQTDNCHSCHGSQVTVSGTEEIETATNPITVPKLSGWPNMGIGRVNPDGSIGNCSACHGRHRFSIAAARQPETCRRCHQGSKSPAWEVFTNSKHGLLYQSSQKPKDLDAVPWKLGEHFSVPNCAVCHAALIVDPSGAVISERTHGFSDRLWVRLYGLIYSHVQPIKADTSVIRNNQGVPLPTSFDGSSNKRFLIPETEQFMRKKKMTDLCQGCHSTQLVRHHLHQMDDSLGTIDKAVLNATVEMKKAWAAGAASDADPFDEPLEILWVEQWMFWANSLRYASAMGGTPDYIFGHSRWWEFNKDFQMLKDAAKQK